MTMKTWWQHDYSEATRDELWRVMQEQLTAANRFLGWSMICLAFSGVCIAVLVTLIACGARP